VSKGDKDNRVMDRKAFRNNHDDIFRKKNCVCNECNGSGDIATKLSNDVFVFPPCVACDGTGVVVLENNSRRRITIGCECIKEKN